MCRSYKQFGEQVLYFLNVTSKYIIDVLFFYRKIKHILNQTFNCPNVPSRYLYSFMYFSYSMSLRTNEYRKWRNLADTTIIWVRCTISNWTSWHWSLSNEMSKRKTASLLCSLPQKPVVGSLMRKYQIVPNWKAFQQDNWLVIFSHQDYEKPRKYLPKLKETKEAWELMPHLGP